MLVNGKWTEDWQPVQKADEKGRFVRQTSSFRHWITPDGAPGPTGEGGFADRALASADIAQAIRQMLCAAVDTYTQEGRPRGCLVVSAANSVAAENAPVLAWLAEHRRQRTESIIQRLQAASDAGQLVEGSNVRALGNCYATLLHGISIQARDGVSKAELLEAVDVALGLLPLPD